MKTYWGSEGIALLILNFGTKWRWAVSFTRRRFTPGERDPLTIVGGCVSPSAAVTELSHEYSPVCSQNFLKLN